MPCKRLDEQVARREDPELAKLMDEFVCVRAIQAWGLDLSVFQFDGELTWAVMFLNADKTIYGRYGSRDDYKNAEKHISMEGLRKATAAALALHKDYRKNKRALAGKKGPKPIWRTPEQIPELRGNKNTRPADGSRGGCIHCHQAHDGKMWTLRKSRNAVPDSLVWPYPMPDKLGFSLDPKEMATVTSVAPGSAAAKARLQRGDKITHMDKQPIISIADVQWVLHNAKAPGTVRMKIDRGGRSTSASLKLDKDWRKADDFTWRVQVWPMRHQLLGLSPMEVVPAGERQRLGIPANGLALRVKKFPPNYVRNLNKDNKKLKIGDIIIGVDGQKGMTQESDLLGYLFQKKAPGQGAVLTVIRGGRPMQVQMRIP